MTITLFSLFLTDYSFPHNTYCLSFDDDAAGYIYIRFYILFFYNYLFVIEIIPQYYFMLLIYFFIFDNKDKLCWEFLFIYLFFIFIYILNFYLLFNSLPPKFN